MKLLSAKLWQFKEGYLHKPHFSNAQILGMEFGIGINYIVVEVVGHKQLYKSFFCFLSVGLCLKVPQRPVLTNFGGHM